MATAAPAAQFGDDPTVDPATALKRRIMQGMPSGPGNPTGQQGGGWEDPTGKAGPTMGPAPFYTPPNGTPNGGGWEAPPGTPVPTMGPPTIGSSPSPNGGGWEAPPGGAPAPTMLPPTIGSSPTEGIPPAPTISSSPIEGVPTPLSAPIGPPALGGQSAAPTSQAPTAAKTLLGSSSSAVPSTITSAQGSDYYNPNQPDPNAPDPGVPPPPAPDVPAPNAPAPPSTPIDVPAPGHTPDNFPNGIPPGFPDSQPAPADRNDQAFIDKTIADWMAHSNPQGHQDANYWKQRILATGGLGPDNLAYWQGRFTEAPGTHVESPAGGGAPAAPAAPSANDTAFADYLKQLMGDRAASQAQRDQVRAMIMDRLGKAGQPVNESDLQIAQPFSAANDAVQRSQQTERTALAERMYAQGQGGLQSGALGQAIQQSAERNAGGLSQLKAGLITQQYQQKQQEMQSLLQMALASGDTQSAQLLQAQIAALNGQINREGMGISLAEFLANLNKSTVAAGAGG